MLEKLTAEMCSQHLNTKFHLQFSDADALELELVRIDDLGITPRQERFSMIFQGPLDRPLTQGTYTMTHEEFGTLDMFIVPIGRDENGVRYEAAFNRVRKQE